MAGWELKRLAMVAVLVAALIPRGVAAQEVLPLRTDLPVWLVGNPHIDGRSLQPYEVRFALGQAGKDGPLPFGAQVEGRAFQVMSLRADHEDGPDVWIRSVATYLFGDPDTPVGEGMVVFDKETLRPVRSAVTRGGSTTSFEYDWVSDLIKQDVDGDEGFGAHGAGPGCSGGRSTRNLDRGHRLGPRHSRDDPDHSFGWRRKVVSGAACGRVGAVRNR